VQELLDAIFNDSLPQIKKLLQKNSYDLNCEVEVGTEYDLDEYDEIPLLFWAIQSGISIEALTLLIKGGIDLHTTSKEGVGALDYAIKHRRKDIVELCNKSGIDLTTSKRKSGLTPLMLAASYNDIDMMEYLINLGADVNIVDKKGMSAIDYATRLGQKSAVNFLENLKK